MIFQDAAIIALEEEFAITTMKIKSLNAFPKYGKLQLSALLQLQKYCKKLLQDYTPELVLTIFREKASQIPRIHTEKDLKAFWNLSVPRFNYNGYVPKSIFHSDAEELIFWSELSLKFPLRGAEFERTMFLFNQYQALFT